MRRFLVTTALAVAALLAAPAAGQAADGAEIALFADAVAATWVPHQNASGMFIDPILGRGSAYGTTMLGYGLLRAGVRRDDPALISAGIRAFNSRLKTKSKVRSYFQILPFAKAYVFAKRELADNPLWRAARPRWERYLRTFVRGPVEGLAGGCIASPRCYHNHEAVQTAAEVALLKTGLRSRERGSPLRRPKALERRLLREVNRVVPPFVGKSGTLTGARSFRDIGLLSDTGSWPLAYHGLSTAMYAISLQALPARKTRRGRMALRRAARASLGLMAPDGDVSWLGRRQQEAWVLASEISVGMTAASVARISAGERDALRTMARTGFIRLARKHPITTTGLANTPKSFTDPAYDFSRGIQQDPINFNGLAVFLLSLGADRAGTYDTSSIPMDRDGHMVVPRQSGFASVRHDNVWYAVRRLEPRSDPRYDFGLLSLKLRTGSGWSDLIEPRPVTGGTPAANERPTVGPVIVRDGRRYLPLGLRFKPGGGGAMTVVTRYRAGSKRFTVPVTYTPTADGIVVSLVTRSGDAVEFRSFHPTPELKLFADGVGDAEARITAPGLVSTTRRDGFISCCEPKLTAVTLRVVPDAADRVSYRVGPASE
ncbi:MAG: hypothetical protein ACRDLS_15335 [Solirubrobacteraceae bacterium]